MGNYIIASELKNYFSEKRILDLATDDPEDGNPISVPSSLVAVGFAGSQTEANILTAISAAESTIDGLLVTRFAVPVSPVGGDVKNAAAVLTIYNLFARKPEFDNNNPKQKERDEIITWLEGIRDDGGQLGTTPTSGETNTVGTTFDSLCATRQSGTFINGGLDSFR